MNDTRARRLDVAWWLACAVASSLWCLSAAAELSATFDEPLYVARGLEAWRSGSHRGLLRLGTMPLPADAQMLPVHLWELIRGAPFDERADLGLILPVARAANLLFWWILLFYGWRAGAALAEAWGARLAVAMLASEPNLLAHAALATTDVAVSACLLALLFHFRTARDAPWRRRVGVPALWFAAALLAKASALVYGPLCLIAVEMERLGRIRVFAPLRRDLGQIAAIALALVFLFCGSDWLPEPSFVAWARALPDDGLGAAMRALADRLTIFSNAGEAFVRQIRHNLRGHETYLFGASGRAFFGYFPLALAIKLPLALLALPVIVAALRPRALWNWATAAAAALLLFSLTARVQLGVRMVLPLVALAVVGLAAAVVRAARDAPGSPARGVAVAAAVLALVSTAAASARAWPQALCHANPLWGGAERIHLHLSDSNCDWGQGLPELQRWARANGVERLDVWYFGTDPAVDRVPLRSLPLHTLAPEDARAALRGRLLAVSASLLHGATVSAAHVAAAAELRGRVPVARTTTFFVYDLRDGACAVGAVCVAGAVHTDDTGPTDDTDDTDGHG